MASSNSSGGGERLLPALLPHPTPHARVATLMKMLVKEHDGAHNNVVRLGNELVAEREARHVAEAWAEVFRQKIAGVENAHRAAEGTVVELRASLGLSKTARDAARFELHNSQQLITCVSYIFLLSLASGAGPPALAHHELGPLFSYGARQRAELADERGKVLILKEEAEKVRVECDHLWHELQAEAKVSEVGQTALTKRGQELAAARAKLQELATGA